MLVRTNFHHFFSAHDNGDTWTSTGISIGSDVEVYNNVAYATAYNGLFKSTDNGDSWELIGSGSNAASISRNSEYLWYASGNGVFRLGLSDDSILSSALPVSTVSTAYVSSTHLYALSDGELFNAALGTETWQNLTSNITADEGTVEQFYVDGDDLYVWFGNFPDYTLYQSSNQGQSFQALNTPDISGQWNGVFSFNPVILSGQNDLAARKAVGAENKTFTLYSSTTRQKAPASGVRTGFPSYNTVEHPKSNGAYTMYE